MMIKQKKLFFIWLFLLGVERFQASPVDIIAGGTDLVSSTTLAYAILCTNPTATGFTYFGSVGNAGQALVSAGPAALPVWQNVFPGYIAGTNFIYAGTTTTLPASPSRTMIISTTAPAAITSSAVDNLAFGYNALNSVTSGTGCIALGSRALESMTIGTDNIGIGFRAGGSITSGIENIAIGSQALLANQTGSGNVAIGSSAAAAYTGSGIVAIGVQALTVTTGTGNTALGYQAGLSNTTGANNTIVGVQALQNNISGSDNTAIGYQALLNSTGSQNVALGYQAGSTLTSGNNNIYLGYQAAPISTTESNNIVIGNSSHVRSLLYGVTGQTSASGVGLLISSSSQLGVLASSKKYKKNIRPVSKKTVQKLLDVDAVTFRYKNDLSKQTQYGMIAEQVKNIFPETIVYDKQGKISTIQYHKFIPLVLQYVQNQEQEIDQLKIQAVDLINQLEFYLQESS